MNFLWAAMKRFEFTPFDLDWEFIFVILFSYTKKKIEEKEKKDFAPRKRRVLWLQLPDHPQNNELRPTWRNRIGWISQLRGSSVVSRARRFPRLPSADREAPKKVPTTCLKIHPKFQKVSSERHRLLFSLSLSLSLSRCLLLPPKSLCGNSQVSLRSPKSSSLETPSSNQWRRFRISRDAVTPGALQVSERGGSSSFRHFPDWSLGSLGPLRYIPNKAFRHLSYVIYVSILLSIWVMLCWIFFNMNSFVLSDYWFWKLWIKWTVVCEILGLVKEMIFFLHLCSIIVLVL